MQVNRVPFSLARLSTGVWFILYALQALLAVPAPLLFAVAIVAGIAWLAGRASERLYEGHREFE